MTSHAVSPPTVSSKDLDRLARASRRIAALTGLGAMVVVASILYAGARLSGQRTQLVTLRDSVRLTRDSLTVAEKALSTTRCALANSRAAINAFHENHYEDAVALYDEALRCDPNNAYLLNLRAYALFKSGRVGEAIDGQQRSLLADTTYAWGYFDLARFFCASSRREEARQAALHAVRLRPDLARVMSRDREFSKLCGKDLVPAR